MPVLAPVITATRPVWSGTSAAVHFTFMPVQSRQLWTYNYTSTYIFVMASPALASLHARSRDVRYRIVVLSPGVADVVGAAGGWLFDRAWAGCDVTALISDHHDDRPLRIVGATTFDLDTALTSEVHTAEPDALVVAAELYQGDARVRHGVLDTIAL